MYKEAVLRQKRYEKPQIKIFIITRRKKYHIERGEIMDTKAAKCHRQQDQTRERRK